MYFIQETDKPNKLFKFFNIIKLQDDKIILPINNEIKDKKKSEKIAIKIKNILKKANCNKIVVSKKISKEEQIMNYLYTYNLNIVDGRWLYEVISDKVLDYVINKKDLRKEEIQLSILVNDLSDIMLDKIKVLADQYKKINIVTNHIEKFKRIEEKLLNENGVIITVTNNKRKSLIKSKIILNVDFPNELINKYRICEDAIIVNIKHEVKIKNKRFNGICVNDYEIEFSENADIEYDYNKLDKYKNSHIYEAQIYKKQPINNILIKINRDKVKITKLIANNITF